MSVFHVLLAAWCGLSTIRLLAGPGMNAKVDTFNYAIGTQTIGASYQFTKESRLVETAEAIRAMGANVIKFQMSKGYAGNHGNVAEGNPNIHTLMELARDEVAHRRVFDMPFAYYVIWVYPFAGKDWHKGLSQAAQAAEYKEVYDLAVHLLTTYRGTGKTFYFGHWEGDWTLRGTGNTTNEASVTPQKIQGMVDWLNTRQRAVDDARRDAKAEGVQVYNYTEVNLVKLAMQGRKTVSNDVIPKTTVDYVSYSSYDTQTDPVRLKAALSYIESKLAPKPGISGKRVFIGEYGFPAEKNPPQKQDEMSRQVMRAALDWGCPFVLYWEMFNNEVDKAGKQRGFWLIDDKGIKQPVYDTHQKFYQWSKQYIAQTTSSTGKAPSFDVFRKAAVSYLDGLNPGPKAK